MTAGSHRQGTRGTGLPPLGTAPQQVLAGGLGTLAAGGDTPAEPGEVLSRPPCLSLQWLWPGHLLLWLPRPPSRGWTPPPGLGSHSSADSHTVRRCASRTPTPHSLETPTRCWDWGLWAQEEVAGGRGLGGNISLECRQAWPGSEKDRSPGCPLPAVRTGVLRTRRPRGRPPPRAGGAQASFLASASLCLCLPEPAFPWRTWRRPAECLLLPRATPGLLPTPAVPGVAPSLTAAAFLPRTHRSTHVCTCTREPIGAHV